MTAQIPESLTYLGEAIALCGQPLDDYFELIGEILPFVSPHTALWRGYVGSWDIQNDRLYLLELRGCGGSGTNVTLRDLFPDYPERVFAHWVSGVFRARRGKQLEYVHAGFASIYEQDMFFHFENGILRSVEIKTNIGPTKQA